MAKCFITGIEVALNDARVLDLGAAHRALRDLRQRVSALERLIDQLGARDTVEFFDPRTRKPRTRTDRRLVSPTVAQALEAAHPEHALFLTWPEYRERGRRMQRALGEKGPHPPGETAPEPDADDGNTKPDDRAVRRDGTDEHPA